MPRTHTDLTESEVEFLTERHLGTLTTIRDDGTPHVVAIAFGYDHDRGRVLIISSDRTQKVKNIERNRRAAVAQVDGRRWLALEGNATVDKTPEGVAQAVEAFESRYRPTSENPNRIGIEIQVDRILGRA